MVTVQELLDQFNLDLDLPAHILKLKFVGNYTKCEVVDDDPEFPNEEYYILSDEKNRYAISISRPDVGDASLEFVEGYIPDYDFDTEWEESYPYDDDYIPPHYINN